MNFNKVLPYKTFCVWFLSLSLEDHLNTILTQDRSCNGGERGAWEDFMKNTESGPPRSPGPLMHVNNDPGQSPARRMWSACALPTAAGSPGITSALIFRCPAPTLPPEPGSPDSRLLGISAGGYRQVSGTVVPGPTGASRGHHEWFENSLTNRALIYPCSG